MRLVIDGRRLTAQRTGVGRYLEGLLSEWASGALPFPEVLVVLQDPAGLERVPKVDGLHCQVVGQCWPGLAWERWGLGKVVRAGDLLFAPSNLVPACWNGPTVLVIFDTLLEALPESFPWHVHLRFGQRYRRSARRAARILVPSESTRRDVEKFYGVSSKRIRVIPLGFDPGFEPRPSDHPLVQEARKALRLGDDPFFLFVGKRSRRRNLPAILAAFREHRARYPQHRLVLVGPGPAQKPAASRGIVVAGHTSEAVLQGLLSSALGLLYPSLYEGFGLPVLEAMASGCPVITLKNSALAEVAGGAAMFLDSADSETLAAGMRALASDPALRAELGFDGLQQAASFSRASCAARVTRALQAAARAAFQPTTAAAAAGDEGASVTQ